MKIVNVTFIINSLQDVHPDISRLIEDCRDSRLLSTVNVKCTGHQAHACQIAKSEAIQDGLLIIAVGGDGTFNEVINGVIEASNDRVCIALIPNGTGNDFCRAQAIVFSRQEMMKMIHNPKPRKIDVGMIKSGSKSRYFLNIADIGFGGYTTQILDRQRKIGIKGGISYSIAILRAFLSFRKPFAAVFMDGKEFYQGLFMMLAICNSSTFGHGLVIHPGANPCDGHLNLTLLGRVTFWDYLSNLHRLKKGKKIHHPDIIYAVAKEIEIKSSGRYAAIETDGESFGAGSVRISVVPKCIFLLNKISARN